MITMTAFAIHEGLLPGRPCTNPREYNQPFNTPVGPTLNLTCQFNAHIFSTKPIPSAAPPEDILQQRKSSAAHPLDPSPEARYSQNRLLPPCCVAAHDDLRKG